MLLELNPEFCVVQDIDFLGYLRREFPHAADDLMCYHNLRENSWVIGTWVEKGRGVISEILVSNHPDGWSRADVETLRFQLSPKRFDSYREWRNEVVERGRAQRRQQDDELKEGQRMKEHWRRSLPGVKRDDPYIAAIPFAPERQ